VVERATRVLGETPSQEEGETFPFLGGSHVIIPVDDERCGSGQRECDGRVFVDGSVRPQKLKQEERKIGMLLHIQWETDDHELDVKMKAYWHNACR